MTLDFLYQYIYLLIVLLMTVNYFNEYKKYGAHLRYGQRNVSLGAGWIITIILVLFIGLRPISSAFSDTVQYAQTYQYFQNQPFAFDWNVDNKIFDNLFIGCSSFGIPISVFFTIIAFFYFFGIFQACKKIFPNAPMLSYVVYLGAFSTFSYGTNGIKAGAAASIFLVALSYKDNLKVCIPLLWVSLGFHHSMLVPIVAFVVAYFFKKPKWYLYGWLFCLLLAAAHITYFQSLFSGFTDEHGARYLVAGGKDAAVSGFRPDFILYSAIPIFIGYYLITKRYIQSEYYNFLWCTYTLTNCVFLLCTYGTFINRIAYLSWLMYPFILLYPFVNAYWSNRQSRYLRYVVYGHLGFTLFMDFIYYA